MPRPPLTALMAGVAFLLAWSVGAVAQTHYPSQPIRFFVQAAAGGLPDTVARIVARRLQERLDGAIG